MVANEYQMLTDKYMPTRGVHQVDTLGAILAQNKILSLTVS